MKKETLLSIFRKHGFGYTGVVSADINTIQGKILSEYDGIEFEAKSIIVCLLPYYTSSCNQEGKIAIYARGKDYHIIAKDYLNKIGNEIALYVHNFRFTSFADTGPLCDRKLAEEAGIGFLGINRCLINEKYGSYAVIGYIVCNYLFERDSALDIECMKCMKCVNSCPGRALDKDGNFNESKCLSYITQKKSELTDFERKLITDNGMIFGCDRCQLVCPHNDSICETEICEFNENLIYSLTLEDIEALSNKEFKKKYGDRAFAWRGKKVLERNIKLTY